MNPHHPWLALAVGIVLALTGCSAIDRAGGLLGVERRAPAVPPAPTPTAQHAELRSEAADFGARVLARVHVEGTPPAAPLVEQATRAAEAVSADVGKPTSPWPLPPVGERTAVESVEARLLDYSAERASAAAEQFDWKRQVAEAAQKPATSGWRLSSPALGTYLLFGIGGVGAALVALTRWAWKWRKVALQLIPGIQNFLDAAGASASPAPAAVLKQSLSAATDKDVKVTIDTVKRGLGQ
jgi:hypothetical protein